MRGEKRNYVTEILVFQRVELSFYLVLSDLEINDKI